MRRVPEWIVCLFMGMTCLQVAPKVASATEPVFPGKAWETATPADMGLNANRLRQAREYALTGGGSGCIIRHGRLVLSWGDPKQRYDLKSTTKSIGMTAVGLALMDGKLKLSDAAADHHPQFGVPPESNAETGWLDEVTLLHLATQTAGFEKPGGYGKLLFRPGTQWHYSDAGPNWLAECVTLKYHRDLSELMFERVFEPLGIAKDDLTWRANAYRDREIEGVPRREFGAGIHANVDAMARIGYLYLRGGQWDGQTIIPRDFVGMASQPVDSVVGLPEYESKHHGNASDHYGLLWWNNADGTLKKVPRDAYWSWGLYDSLILVIPSLDIVVSRAGKSWKRDGGNHYDVLRPFFEPIVAAVEMSGNASRSKPAPSKAPYPSSSVITSVEWAADSTIVRKARGSDNWPLTWADDGHLYTAYGDGWGFEPRVERKLSLGLARVEGGPKDFQGINVRSPSIEQIGDGRRGRKASGVLMVDGVLYLWARNAGNAQLAWSKDRGAHWEWSDWKFTTSFGYPTFLNFGRNYSGARDDYVYTYSHDSDSAYEPADRMVLARVNRDRILDRDAWEFFSGLDENGVPRWTSDVDQRSAVFKHPRRCYRSGITYNAALGRYLWCQILPGESPRFSGGFGIYDAPEPWGPWTTVDFTEAWDVGPGETASFPTKWIRDDGRTLSLVFSGDDCFSVRTAKFSVSEADSKETEP